MQLPARGQFVFYGRHGGSHSMPMRLPKGPHVAHEAASFFQIEPFPQPLRMGTKASMTARQSTPRACAVLTSSRKNGAGPDRMGQFPVVEPIRLRSVGPMSSEEKARAATRHESCLGLIGFQAEQEVKRGQARAKNQYVLIPADLRAASPETTES